MFYNCRKLKAPDENENFEFKFNGLAITDMSYMFYDCKLLRKRNMKRYFNINEYKMAEKTEVFTGCL